MPAAAFALRSALQHSRPSIAAFTLARSVRSTAPRLPPPHTPLAAARAGQPRVLPSTRLSGPRRFQSPRAAYLHRLHRPASSASACAGSGESEELKEDPPALPSPPSWPAAMGAIVKEEVAYGRYLTVFNREEGTSEYCPPRHRHAFCEHPFLELSGVL